ncbi:hypothetical protein [Streptomyces pakalii]|uniref:Uncharacterized protein n=1 Tax=Streptomyces pakalii TaxID=3036494 RepID=A0ABT7D385_9ACTN|nr:hypothetical protein [Streptomyces pakalii]MDJ1640259.1 hypothetical protein [Streptomyces pakalii]
MSVLPSPRGEELLSFPMPEVRPLSSVQESEGVGRAPVASLLAGLFEAVELVDDRDREEETDIVVEPQVHDLVQIGVADLMTQDPSRLGGPVEMGQELSADAATTGVTEVLRRQLGTAEAGMMLRGSAPGRGVVSMGRFFRQLYCFRWPFGVVSGPLSRPVHLQEGTVLPPCVVGHTWALT